MWVKALKDFASTTYGNISAGQVLPVDEGIGQQFIQHGLVEAFEPPPKPERPPLALGSSETQEASGIPTDAGGEAPSSSSPADRVPVKKTRVQRRQKAR